jgi:hypothetical protein
MRRGQRDKKKTDRQVMKFHRIVSILTLVELFYHSFFVGLSVPLHLPQTSQLNEIEEEEVDESEASTNTEFNQCHSVG